MPFRKIYSGVLVVGLSFFLVQSYSRGLLAEDAESKADAENIHMYQAKPITVTAQKREENVQEIPEAITAFTETELEDAGAETIADVIDMIPNLSVCHYQEAG